MDYSSWRITFQSPEAAARAAFAKVEELAAEAARLRYQLTQRESEVKHWQKNHEAMVHRCQYLTQRKDLPVDRIPAYEAHARRIAELELHNEYQASLIAARGREAA